MKYFVPNGFEFFKTNNGVFIVNSRDKKVFKWINVEKLTCNGIDSSGKTSKYGRRQFDGNFFPGPPNDEGFLDLEAKIFEEFAPKIGGFYISVEKEKPCYKPEADKFAKSYLAESADVQSLLPSGAAFDCMLQSIYERFLRFVVIVKMKQETLYDAWNRIAEFKKETFLTNGIWGIKGLMDHAHEHTSEYIDDLCCPYRGEFRMNLISYTSNESRIDPKYVSWCLGLRNYCHNNYANLGYRIIILPK